MVNKAFILSGALFVFDGILLLVASGSGTFLGVGLLVGGIGIFVVGVLR